MMDAPALVLRKADALTRGRTAESKPSVGPGPRAVIDESGVAAAGLPPQRLAAGYSTEVQQWEHELLAKYGVQHRAFSTITAHRLACRKFGKKGKPEYRGAPAVADEIETPVVHAGSGALRLGTSTNEWLLPSRATRHLSPSDGSLPNELLMGALLQPGREHKGSLSDLGRREEQTMTMQKKSHMQRRYESLAQAADRTGVSTRTLRRRIAAGELRAFRAGARIIRLDPSEVDALFTPTC